MSFGNQFTEIELDSNKNTLIVGKNGSGKSSAILDSITFALYGKPYRNINKPQLMNTITNKALVVEIEFSIGKKEYKIVRGMKPNIFDIFIDGELVKQDSLSKDYQTFLENNILKINYKSFCQIVILGASDYVPFMKLPAHARRSVIEDLLDLQVFSSMNVILKQRVSDNKDDLVKVEQDIKVYQSNLALHESHLKSIEQDLKEQNKVLKEKIAAESKKIDDNRKQEAKVGGKAIKLLNDISKYDKYKEKHQEVKDKIKTLENGKANTLKQKQFYTDFCNCPTCKQEIEEKFKNSVLEKCEKSIIKIDANLKKGYDYIDQLMEKFKEVEKLNDELQKVNNQRDKLNTEWYASAALKESYIKQQAELVNKVQLADDSKKIELTEKLAEVKEERRKLNDQKEILSIAGQLLKDGGIKTLIIRQYIPVMNKIINQYLNHMNFYIDFTLDDNFDELIKSRHRDEFSYNSFSEGEKFRIDLAILFAWRAIAKMRNTAATNILIFDEIADGSLDNDGTDDFMKILNTLTGDTNVFIISHQTENTSDKFDRILSFTKVKNFSKMEKL